MIQPIDQVVVDKLTCIMSYEMTTCFVGSYVETTQNEFEMASLDCTLHVFSYPGKQKDEHFEK